MRSRDDRDVRIAAIIGAVTFAAYLALPERIYHFDGVLFAGFIKVALALEHGFDRMFDFPKHYLYLPSFYLLARAIEPLIAVPVDIYRVMQLVSGVLLAGTNAAAYLLFRRFGADRVACAAAALLWAFTRTHWDRAVEGQVYPVGNFFALCTLMLASSSPWPMATRRLMAISLLTSLAILYHVSHVLVAASLVGAWLLSYGRTAIVTSGLYLGSVLLLGASIPIIHYRLYDVSELNRWLLLSMNNTEYYDSRFFKLPSFDSGIMTFFRSLVAIEGAGFMPALGLVSLLGMSVLLAASARLVFRADRETRAAGTVWAVAFVAYALFFGIALPGYKHFWEIQCAAVVVLIAMGLPKSRALGTTALLIAVTGATFLVNLTQAVFPVSRAMFNGAAHEAVRIGRLSPPNGELLVAGSSAGDNDLKAYALYFAERGWLSFDMLLASLPSNVRCTAIRDVLTRAVDRHGVLFASSRVIEADGIGRTFRSLGCSLDDAARTLAGRTCMRVEDGDPFGFFLLFDDPGRPEVAAAEQHLAAIAQDDPALRRDPGAARFACDHELSSPRG